MRKASPLCTNDPVENDLTTPEFAMCETAGGLSQINSRKVKVISAGQKAIGAAFQPRAVFGAREGCRVFAAP
ncbi:hypothetical protein [Phenylobacterium sp.]|jgi:hypothetical protein|uniref:hypothetical protein n=1 Tax=Phenylobacterium sp. TaxID=1871053 RepID=UPI002F41CACD